MIIGFLNNVVIKVLWAIVLNIFQGIQLGNRTKGVPSTFQFETNFYLKCYRRSCQENVNEFSFTKSLV